MSAPRSKQFQMRSRNIDRVLRHRRQLNLRDIIDNREVLNAPGTVRRPAHHQTTPKGQPTTNAQPLRDHDSDLVASLALDGKASANASASPPGSSRS